MKLFRFFSNARPNGLNLTNQISDMKDSFAQLLFEKHQKVDIIPSTSTVCKLFTRLLLLLFPEQASRKYRSPEIIRDRIEIFGSELKEVLSVMENRLPSSSSDLAERFMASIPQIHHLLSTDVQAALEGDPAATNEYEIIRTYPGFYAMAFYRMAHGLHVLNIPLLPRLLTEYAHSRTGIDIHPGAEIGAYFFIDHGTGVVIGETTNIGERVKLYQGVTLGALSVSKSLASTKRHPTIENNVVIYSGATILGGETIIGSNSIIGGNVWLTESVPANSKVYFKASLEVKQ